MQETKTRVTAVRHPDVIAGEACLVLIYPPGPLMGRRYPLHDGPTHIGRGHGCPILIDLDSVSRRHAVITTHGSSVLLEDLKSTNGTYVNERPVARQALQNGDLVQTGNAIFKFLLGGNIEADYHEAIYRMTIVDGLTEVFNKRYMLDFLDRELARCARYKRPLSIVMVDIDHFKKVNDAHGHLIGDQVLREFARRISSRIRREELLARYGGEEFVAVLPEADHAGAMHFAEQLRRLVGKEPIAFEETTLSLTISAGVATISGEAMDPLGFLRLADQNLYQAKNSGRNRVVGNSLSSSR